MIFLIKANMVSFSPTVTAREIQCIYIYMCERENTRAVHVPPWQVYISTADYVTPKETVSMHLREVCKGKRAGTTNEPSNESKKCKKSKKSKKEGKG